MADEPILNPEDIKAIAQEAGKKGPVSSLWTGDTTAYDFFGASLKKDEKIQAANDIHANMVRSMEKALSRSGSLESHAEFVKHEMVTFAKIKEELAFDKNIIAQWQNVASSQEGFFLLDRALFSQIYTGLLGGRAGAVVVKQGVLTALEETSFRKMCQPIMEVFSKAWSLFGKWNFTLRQLLQDPEEFENLRWRLDTFRATFKLKIGEVEGNLVIYFTRDVLDLLGHATDKPSESSKKGGIDRQWFQAVLGAITEIPISFTALLGRVQVPLSSVLSLQVGNEFEMNVPEKHPIFIAGKSAFQGSIGSAGDLRAVKVLSETREATHG